VGRRRTGLACAACLDRVAALVLRAWGRWLPGLGASSASYLLDQFVRRKGAVAVSEHTIDVRLERAPLDQILRMAGYLADAPAAAWLGGRVVRFHTGSRP
jgi:hypothetical protein